MSSPDRPDRHDQSEATGTQTKPTRFSEGRAPQRTDQAADRAGQAPDKKETGDVNSPGKAAHDRDACA
jgi:hypothetical protein